MKSVAVIFALFIFGFIANITIAQMYGINVTTNSSKCSDPITRISGTYAAGSLIAISRSSANIPQPQGSDYQCIFQSWTGSGPGSYTGTELNPQISLIGNITEVENIQATAIPEYTVIITSNPSACGLGVVFGAGYGPGTYTIISGTQDGLSAANASPSGGGTCTFLSWTGNGASSYSGSQSALLTITSNIQETANFNYVPQTTIPSSVPTTQTTTAPSTVSTVLGSTTKTTSLVSSQPTSTMPPTSSQTTTIAQPSTSGTTPSTSLTVTTIAATTKTQGTTVTINSLTTTVPQSNGNSQPNLFQSIWGNIINFLSHL